MTSDERQVITQFIERVSGAPAVSTAGSVPATRPALPPIDRDADALLAELFSRYPEARYRISQMAFVQEAALTEAQNRIKRLEWELDQTKQQVQTLQAQMQQVQQMQQAAPPPPSSGGIFGGLFGGGQRAASPPPGAPGSPWGAPQGQYAPPPPPQYAPPQYAPPPQPQYMPGYQPGMLQGGGTGFLGSALRTAAGVAGGMVVGNALMDMFSGHHGYGQPMGGGFMPQPIVGGPVAAPWGAPVPEVAPPPADPAGFWGNESGFGGDAAALPPADPPAPADANDGFWSKDAIYQDSQGSDDGSGGGGGFDSGGGFDDNT